MHDRFLFRFEDEYVHDAANKNRMFNNYIYDRAGVATNKAHTAITVEELEALQAKARTIPVPKAIINKFISLMNGLQKNATISISDRRANECFKVLQGSALLNGRNKVGLDDFNALKYVLWEKKEDIDTIGAEISKIVNPYDEEFAKFTRQFNEVKDKIESSSDIKDRNQAYFQYQNSIKNTIGRMNKLISEASTSGKDVTEFAKFRDEIVSYHTNLANEILGGTLGNSFNSVTLDSDIDNVNNDTDSDEEDS
jgi:hypothetical protein